MTMNARVARKHEIDSLCAAGVLAWDFGRIFSSYCHLRLLKEKDSIHQIL
jgi:hypothetical protein